MLKTVSNQPELMYRPKGKRSLDRTSNKLTTKFSTRKRQNKELADMLYNSGLKKQALKQRSCFSTVVYGAYDIKGKSKELTTVYRCDSRFCSNCQQAQSARKSEMATKIIDKLDKQNRDRVCYVELTATTKNSTNALNLYHNIKDLNCGITKLLNYVCIGDYLIGAIKFLETPISIQRGTVSYNQHYHVLLALDKSYFNGHNRMSEKAIGMKLKKAMKLNYIPKIQLKRIYDTKDKSGNVTTTAKNNAIKVAKYNSKPYPLLDTLKSHSNLIKSGIYTKIIHDLYIGTKGTQTVSYLKECKYIKRDIERVAKLKETWIKRDCGEYESYYTYIYDDINHRYRLDCISSFNPVKENRLVTIDSNTYTTV